MRAVINRDALSKALGFIRSCCGSSKLLPVYSQVLISAEPEGLTLRGCGISSGIRLVLPGNITESGLEAVDFSLFGSLVGGMVGEDISLIKGKTAKQLTISSGGSRCRLACTATDDFPSEPVGNGSVALSLSNLVSDIDGVLFACATSIDTSFSTLSGVYFDWISSVTMGCDRSKLAVQFPENVWFEEGSGSSVLPARDLKNLGRLSQYTDDDRVDVSVTGSKVIFSTKFATFYVNCIAGAYPSQLLDSITDLKDSPEIVKFTATVESILNSTRMANTMISAGTGSYKVPSKWKMKDGGLSVSLVVAGVGEYADIINLIDSEGEINVLVDTTEIMMVLRNCPGEAVVFEFTNAKSPIHVLSPSKSGWGVYLMPMISRGDLNDDASDF